MFMSLIKCAVCLLALGSSVWAADKLVVSGVTEPLMDVTLSSPAQGTIHERKFEEGDEVEKGAVLMQLDNTLETLETQRRKEVAERNRTDFEATRQLFEKTKAVSKEEMEKKQMEYKVALAEWEIAQEQLKRRSIVAPFGGTIMEIYLQPGAGVEPYQPIVRLVMTKLCVFVGHIEGTASTGLTIGQPVTLEVQGTKQKVNGKLSFIAPVADSASGLVRIKATFENADGAVRPGLSAKMIIQ
jgi:RND family efflux transporter MFP subunit